MGFRRAIPSGATALAATLLLTAIGVWACGGGGLVKYYEYDEDIYLSVDGSATIYLNASVPALVNLRGMDLDTRPNVNLDRAKVRRLFSTDAARVTRVSRWRRFGRQFVQVRMAVDEIKGRHGRGSGLGTRDSGFGTPRRAWRRSRSPAILYY